MYQLSLTSLRSSLSAAGRPRSHGCLDGRLGDAGWRRDLAWVVGVLVAEAMAGWVDAGAGAGWGGGG